MIIGTDFLNEKQAITDMGNCSVTMVNTTRLLEQSLKYQEIPKVHNQLIMQRDAEGENERHGTDEVRNRLILGEN